MASLTTTKMKKMILITMIVIAIIINCNWFYTQATSNGDKHLDSLTRCLMEAEVTNFTTSKQSPQVFFKMLYFSVQNRRFQDPGVPTPAAIILPSDAVEAQSAFFCSKSSGYQVLPRSGGHSYEGLSSTSPWPHAFVILDLMNLRTVDIDAASATAWVAAGLTLGEIYAAIAAASDELGFPAGVCPTVGAGGHISGAGYGFLGRKYGTAADNVVDAQLLDADGKVLDRSAMGEELFWAIRGGGGGSWGIVLAWKLRLVPVPKTVTTFRTWRYGLQTDLALLIQRWQATATSAPPELFHAVYLEGYVTEASSADTHAAFYGQYLGNVTKTLALMGEMLPELGLTASDCRDGKWIDAVAAAAYVNVTDLTSRDNRANQGYFKAKSDYVMRDRPLPREALEEVFTRLEANPGSGYLIFEPYGGVMDTIPSDAIAFPYRNGILFNIQYQALWNDDRNHTVARLLVDWLQELYAFMKPYVSSNPRATFVNYIDLDLGNATSFVGANASWGQSYFLSNFARLARVKGQFDPKNLFTHPQSVPPLFT